ncbi:MAG: hypothetical protein JO184_00840 [Gammaproteobacteria bacterium]|nr:hypothetical protein [Gammaproteobacteria bacterium]MBV8306460.1 hypothetical protein [Gammaproteobacteria bacterium]MBV8405562.1 hypothetical protein [Gammaproteobacteria bacterium]
MKIIAPITLVMCISGGALAQESPTQSVTADRLGTWSPRDVNSCDSIYGDGRQLCLADRYRMHLEQQAHDEQLAVQRAQAENLRLHNELLKREIARLQAAAAAPSAAELAATPGFAGWQSENRWFGSDRARTEYALLYAKDLRQEQPDLSGRLFLNAVSSRIKEVFAR